MTQPAPKRIMRIVAQLNISGPALQAILLTSELDKLGYECYLVGGASDDNDSMRYVADDYDIEPTLIPDFAHRPLDIINRIKTIWALYQLMRELKPDVVHTHNPRAGFVGRIAARLAGVPVVVHTLHEYPFRGYYNRLSTLFFIYMERFGAYLSDSIITLSQGLRHALADTYKVTGKSRIVVLPLGFDLESLAQMPTHTGVFRQQWGIPNDIPLVGTIGRLMPVKNNRLFLQSAQKVHAVQPDVHFVLIGDGDERESLEAYADELGLTSNITFAGWQQNMEQVYSDLDVLVNSSLNEGTPVPIIEALSAGCSVVATDVGGVSELLDGGEFGVLVASGDVDALSEGMLNILQRPPETATAQSAMLRRYSIGRLASDLDSLYRGLSSKKRN